MRCKNGSSLGSGIWLEADRSFLVLIGENSITLQNFSLEFGLPAPNPAAHVRLNPSDFGLVFVGLRLNSNFFFLASNFCVNPSVRLKPDEAFRLGARPNSSVPVSCLASYSSIVVRLPTTDPKPPFLSLPIDPDFCTGKYKSMSSMLLVLLASFLAVFILGVPLLLPVPLFR